MQTVNEEMETGSEEWFFDQVNRATKKFLSVITDDARNDLDGMPDYPKRLILSNALFNAIKVVNYPVEKMTAEDNSMEFLRKYDHFADKFSGLILEMGEALQSWEP